MLGLSFLIHLLSGTWGNRNRRQAETLLWAGTLTVLHAKHLMIDEFGCTHSN